MSIFMEYGLPGLLTVGGAIVAWAIAYPPYNIWVQKLQGQADLAQAENETRIVVRKAERELDAAKLYAQADVERAKGIAASIREVENALGGPEGYLRWKYINMLEEQDGVSQIIYVPTEAGLPILEAGKRPTV
ncbi:membrane protease subunit [Methylobacterium sp. Gmos1]